MKYLNIFLAVSTISLVACNNPIAFNTKVNEDGSLDKTIQLITDSTKANSNIFGIRKNRGWSIVIDTVPNAHTYKIKFYKHFESADKMNQELDRKVDSLFQSHSKFQTKFQWFYTSFRYSETIRPINRFKKVSPKNYFTIEDSLFIERLPEKGRDLSKSDSLSLAVLNEKIEYFYSAMGIFNEIFPVLEQVVRQYNPDKKWTDTIYKSRKKIQELIRSDEGKFSSAKNIADTLHIPLPKEADKEFERLSKGFDERLHFMSFARDGNYSISFEMPWKIIKTNADSVAGNSASWKPLMHKFAFSNFEMYVECQKINWGEISITFAIVGVLIFTLRRSGRFSFLESHKNRKSTLTD